MALRLYVIKRRVSIGFDYLKIISDINYICFSGIIQGLEWFTNPVHPKGDQSWVFIGRTDAEAQTPILWPPHAKS